MKDPKLAPPNPDFSACKLDKFGGKKWVSLISFFGFRVVRQPNLVVARKVAVVVPGGATDQDAEIRSTTTCRFSAGPLGVWGAK